MSDTAGRWLSGAQFAFRAMTFARPHSTVDVLTARGAAKPDPRIMRVLGTRQIAQGAVGLIRPDSTVMSVGALIDATHALSLFPVILFSRRYRAAAAGSAGLGLTAAAIDITLAD